MGHLVSWVVKQTTPLKDGSGFHETYTDKYEVFCDGNHKEEAEKKYNHLVSEMQAQDDTKNGIYTVQLCKILNSTEPQHHDKTWGDFDREDLKMIPIAEKAEWEVIFNRRDVVMNRNTPENPPLWTVMFKKRGFIVWNYDNKWWYSSSSRVNQRLLTSLNEILSL